MSDLPYQLHGIRKRCGASFQLSIDELSLHRGETFALLGPTGAGKTTLLRLLTGIEACDDGTILFQREPLDRTTPLDRLRRISLVPQRPILLADTVRANVAYGCRVRGAADSSRVSAVLERLGLGPWSDQAARSLSGGQMQLVAIARSLVLEPDVLLLDEPTANLDPAHVALVEQVVQETQNRSHLTVVWATHNLHQAQRISHRVGFLWQGELIEVAATETFFQSPRRPETAAFVQGQLVY